MNEINLFLDIDGTLITNDFHDEYKAVERPFLDIFLELGLNFGWMGWLFWALILNFVIKVKHPPVVVFQPLDSRRMFLGYLSLFILFISFAPSPFIVSF